MSRYFNTEGVCRPDIHYMVRLDDRLRQIREQYVERGKYFVINRGRQYGKTTTLRALAEYLRQDYLVISLDFQELGTDDLKDEATFARAFAQIFAESLRAADDEKQDQLTQPLEAFIGEQGACSMRDLFEKLSGMCGMAAKPVVLIVDEVDSASNNRVFIDFLAMLRGYYLKRDLKPVFHSVILAGVYDIKNLKLKIRPEEEHKYNSPWNIAADFNVDMSFSVAQIMTMLQAYENDNHTGMEIETVAREIYEYTSGYPYLVSRICQIMDQKLQTAGQSGIKQMIWTDEGVVSAVGVILTDPIPLFQSMVRQLGEYPEIKQMLKAILFQGKRISYNTDTPAIQLAVMFGYIVNRDGSIQVANRIFETRLYNLFLSEEELTSVIYDEAQGNRALFFDGGRLDMTAVLARFVEHFHDIYGNDDMKFVEEYGRKFFLLYLKPIINGTGNYYIEAQTRDARRTDVVVDYLGEQFVVELKIWRGNEYNERGEEQLADYLDYFHLDRGYMLSFNFNQKKEIGIKRVLVGGKEIVEAVV